MTRRWLSATCLRGSVLSESVGGEVLVLLKDGGYPVVLTWVKHS
jgi:hypothetical protein